VIAVTRWWKYTAARRCVKYQASLFVNAVTMRRCTVSNYSHIDFAANELSYVLLNDPGMRWQNQVELIEGMAIFHELDIDT